MVFEEWEMNLIIESLEDSTGNMISDMVVTKLKKLQSSSKNKRYTFRSTDWLSEAAKKKKVKDKTNYQEEGLI